MEFNQVCQSLQQFFLSNRFCKVLMPLSVPLMFAGAGLTLLNRFISVGGFVSAAAYFAFMLGLLMVLSNQLFQLASYGLGIWAAAYVLSFLQTALFNKYVHIITWGNVVYSLVWGYLAYLLYKKSLVKN